MNKNYYKINIRYQVHSKRVLLYRKVIINKMKKIYKMDKIIIMMNKQDNMCIMIKHKHNMMDIMMKMVNMFITNLHITNMDKKLNSNLLMLILLIIMELMMHKEQVLSLLCLQLLNKMLLICLLKILMIYIMPNPLGQLIIHGLKFQIMLNM